MRGLHLAVISAALLLSLDAASADGQLVCIRPVPLTIKELAARQAAGSLSDEALKINVDYLTLKYCALVDGLPASASSVSLGSGCEMQWGQRLGETIYWSTCAEGLRQFKLDSINRFLPPELALNQEVFEAIQENPLFANPPQMRLSNYHVTSSMVSVGMKMTMDTHTTLRALGPGISREEVSSTSISRTAGGALQSTTHTDSVGNTFITFTSHTTIHNRFGGGTTVAKVVNLKNMSGRIFPIEVGREFHYEITTHYDTVFAGQKHSDDSTQKHTCQVTRRFEASEFHPQLEGNAYFIQCDVETTFKRNSASNSQSQFNTIFFASIGASISADPSYGHQNQRLIMDGRVSIVGKTKYKNIGSYILKDVAIVH